MEDIKSRHSREKKDLQAKITSKKKSASKKSRKGVNAECDELETTLRLRHEEELGAINGEDHIPDVEFDSEQSPTDFPVENKDNETDEVTTGLKKVTFDTPDGDDASEIASTDGSAGQKKRNRQKERLARRAAEQEAATLEAEKEALRMPNWKKQERAGMDKAFQAHGLVEEEIRPDGHCLFSAIADQLKEVDVPLGEGDGKEAYKIVRARAADYVEAHREDFEGFMEVPLKIHTYKIRETAEWGGHIELTALARSYGVVINVVQNSRIDKFEPEQGVEDPRAIWLAYYLHGYGLGEHYNSLRKAP